MRLGRREFERLVQQALEKVPPKFQQAMDNLDIIVQDFPSRDQLEQTETEDRWDLLGLFEGISLRERTVADTLMLPNRITLFQRPIEEGCEAPEQVVEEVRVTLLHEIGHYLGLDEDDLHRLGYE